MRPLQQLRSDRWVQSAKQQKGYPITAKKIILMASMVLAFEFASAQRSNAGTEMVEPYTAPAPTYNLAPPPPRLSFIRPLAITGHGLGSTVRIDSTDDTVIGVHIITGADRRGGRRISELPLVQLHSLLADNVSDGFLSSRSRPGAW